MSRNWRKHFDDDDDDDDDDEHLGERCSGMPPSLLTASTSPASVTCMVVGGAYARIILCNGED